MEKRLSTSTSLQRLDFWDALMCMPTLVTLCVCALLVCRAEADLVVECTNTTTPRIATILKGGLIRTFTGQNLSSYESIAVYVCTEHVGDTNDHHCYPKSPELQKNCTISSDSEMHCATPDIELDLPDHDDVHPIENTFKIQDYTFYYGFITNLDDIERAQLHSYADLPWKCGEIDMYYSPQIYKEDRVSRGWWWYEHIKQLHVKGKYLLSPAVSASDYRIQLDHTPTLCNVTYLNDQVVTCHLHPINYQGASEVTIRVNVGSAVSDSAGKIRVEEHIHNNITAMGVLIAVVVMLLVLITLAAQLAWRRRKRKYADYKRFAKTLPEDIRKPLKDNLITKGFEINSTSTLGSGNFGTVCRGKYRGETVACKALQRTEDITSTVLFLREALVMTDFKHKNILSLLGIVILKDVPYILMPFMENGDLKRFVSNRDNHLTTDFMTDLCLQVCRGMMYMERRNAVHRDLAARNCLVDKNCVVKVCDFGFTRNLMDEEYYRPGNENLKVPVRWLPVETLQNFKYSTKSDVWSFGVLMWEVFSKGAQPYGDVLTNNIIHHVVNGARLAAPPDTPQNIYEIMTSCWQSDPEDRPTFKVLQQKLLRAKEDYYMEPVVQSSKQDGSTGNYIELAM